MKKWLTNTGQFKPAQTGHYHRIFQLGVLPYLFALISNNPYVFGFGLFFCFVASGDIMILWLIRKLPGYQIIQDHPSKGGVILLENQE